MFFLAVAVTNLPRINLDYWSIDLFIARSVLAGMGLHRIVKIRHRYFLTRRNRLRLRYVVGAIAIFSLTVTSLLGSISPSIAFVPSRLDMVEAQIDNSSPSLELVSLPAMEKEAVKERYLVIEPDVATSKAEEILLPLLDINKPKILVDELAVTASKEVYGPLLPRDEILKINPGDTIAGTLQNSGVSGAEAYRAVKAISRFYDPKLVKPGQVISISMEPTEQGMALSSLSMKMGSTKELIIDKDKNGIFRPSLIEKKVVLKMKAAKATISSSLYASAARAGIPASIIAEMIRLYSYEVDFQRDTRRGDTVEILYETYETEDGDFARYGNILFANLKVNGTKIPIYRYESKDGNVQYFREDGLNLKNTLMQTPIDGARISSGFGMRHHPVLGYNKMHKGIDFAASRGTPIYAAGDGVIEKAGRNGGYGNYIRIRHVNNLKTAYAHMKRFAKGMKPGKRVKQGQVIGYVGTTGRSTGPHLHFEVLNGCKQLNPKSIKSANREKLKGKRLSDFKARVAVIKQEYAKLSQDLKFAQNSY